MAQNRLTRKVWLEAEKQWSHNFRRKILAYVLFIGSFVSLALYFYNRPGEPIPHKLCLEGYFPEGINGHVKEVGVVKTDISIAPDGTWIVLADSVPFHNKAIFDRDGLLLEEIGNLYYVNDTLADTYEHISRNKINYNVGIPDDSGFFPITCTFRQKRNKLYATYDYGYKKEVDKFEWRDGRLWKETIAINGRVLFSEFEYEEGLLTGIIGTGNDAYNTRFEYLDFDRQDNWISRLEFNYYFDPQKPYKTVLCEREITYFD